MTKSKKMAKPSKIKKRISFTDLMSEKVLARDWNRKEEDKAWKSLQH